MSEAHFRCSACGTTGICTQNISGEHHRILQGVNPWESGLTDEQREMARTGRLARVFLCGTWTRVLALNERRS